MNAVVALMMTAVGWQSSETAKFEARCLGFTPVTVSARNSSTWKRITSPASCRLQMLLATLQRVRRCGLFPVARILELTVRGTCRPGTRAIGGCCP